MATGFPIIFGVSKLWTPDQTPTDLWLDAADASTITLNGSTVSQWNDKSGNARHFSQSTATSQPGYSTNQLNGYPILTFDGTDDFLDGGNILPATNSISVWIIARQNTISTTSSAPYLGRMNSAIADGNYLVRGQLSSQTNLSFAQMRTSVATYSANITGTPNSNWTLVGMRYSSTDNQLQSLRNGSSSTAVATSGTAADPGIACRIAARSAGTINYLHVDVAEIVVLLSAPAALVAPRPQIEGYLSWKYGLQGNLPATHPYKNSPPTI